MIGRRSLLAMLGAGAVGLPLMARAALAADMVYHVGILEFLPRTQNSANFTALQQGLRDAGYVEGRNLAITYFSADADAERFPTLAAELVKTAPDVIVTRGIPGTLAARDATKTIPIVMTAVADPTVIVESLSRPGGNVTGLGTFVRELAAKQVELLLEIVPGMTRLGYIGNSANPGSADRVREVKAAVEALGITVIMFDLQRAEDTPRVLSAVAEARLDALLAPSDVLRAGEREIAALTASHHLPAVYANRDYADAGGLLTYGVSRPALYRRAAAYVDKILKGARPGDLPVQMPTELELVVNMKAARAIGLTIPPSVLARADAVIE